MRIRHTTLRAIVATALFACAPTAIAQDAGLAARAERLTELRSEVARLGDELGQRRDEADATIRALQAQQLDLEVQLGREALRLRQLEDLMDARRTAASEDADLEEQVRPVVMAGLERARTTLSEAIPYRHAERLDALDEIRRAVEAGELAPSRALGRLWAFLEDERRLTTENALDRQIVEFRGREVLAEVARLGQIGLFCLTPDGEVGLAVHDGSGWTWQPLTDKAAVDRVSSLFDSLRKGIRTGWYELPWAFGGHR